MGLELSLRDGRVAKVAHQDQPLLPAGIVRSALGNPAIGEHGSRGPYVLAFFYADVGKPMKPIRVSAREITGVEQQPKGWLALVFATTRLAYVTLPNGVGKNNVMALITAAQESPPAQDRCLFFAEVDGKPALLDTKEIRKTPKTSRR